MSYYQNYYHIVFRTHKSQRTISEQNERLLYMYIFGFCRNHGVNLLRINGMPDHIHLCVSIPPDMAVADFVRELKKASSHYLNNHPKEFPMFEGWAAGYACLTYSNREKDAVVNYIKGQKEHHKRITFADEMISILKAAGLSTDTPYFKADWIE